jgi:acyl-CoA hydrolase
MRVVAERQLAIVLGAPAGTVWSEMFTDGVLGLAKAGALDPGQPVTGSFAFGSTDLYAWMDRNQDVRMLRTETVNDPARIARRSQMTSVNGALHSPGGQAIIALRSWHPKADVSTVVPRIDGPVTSF